MLCVSICMSADQEQMVTLTWPNFKSLVELYAKDGRKLAKLLGSEFPNNDLLEVPTKQEPMNILGRYAHKYSVGVRVKARTESLIHVRTDSSCIAVRSNGTNNKIV